MFCKDDRSFLGDNSRPAVKTAGYKMLDAIVTIKSNVEPQSGANSSPKSHLVFTKHQHPQAFRCGCFAKKIDAVYGGHSTAG